VGYLVLACYIFLWPWGTPEVIVGKEKDDGTDTTAG
jgi:hypothetical protein